MVWWSGWARDTTRRTTSVSPSEAQVSPRSQGCRRTRSPWTPRATSTSTSWPAGTGGRAHDPAGLARDPAQALREDRPPALRCPGDERPFHLRTQSHHPRPDPTVRGGEEGRPVVEPPLRHLLRHGLLGWFQGHLQGRDGDAGPWIPEERDRGRLRHRGSWERDDAGGGLR